MVEGRGHRRRHRLAERYGWKCFYCHADIKCRGCFPYARKYERATIDHRIPKCKGGTLSPDNIVLSCPRCNTRKGSLDPGEPLPLPVPRVKPEHWHSECTIPPKRNRGARRRSRRGFATETDALASVAHVPKLLVVWLCECGSWHVGAGSQSQEKD